MSLKYEREKVLQKSLKQKFNNCNDATLVVGQKDIVGGAFFIFGLNVKTITVTCNATGDKIHKRNWNEQTKADAEEFSSQYELSKKGWYIMGTFLLVGLLVVAAAFINVFVANRDYSKTLNSKTREEKKELLSKLDTGDLIICIGAVYRIENIGETTLEVKKSNNVIKIKDLYKSIHEEDFTDISFDSNKIITINRTSLLNNLSINKDLTDEYGGEGVVSILDR